MELKKVFDGSNWCIYYLKIDNFVPDLHGLGEVLEKLSNVGKVVAIIPNIGLTKTSIFFGTSFQGVKGLAIVLEKKKVFEKPPNNL